MTYDLKKLIEIKRSTARAQPRFDCQDRTFSRVTRANGYDESYEVKAYPVPGIMVDGTVRVDIRGEQNQTIRLTVTERDERGLDGIQRVVLYESGREPSVDEIVPLEQTVRYGVPYHDQERILRTAMDLRDVHRELILRDPNLPESAKMRILGTTLI